MLTLVKHEEHGGGEKKPNQTKIQMIVLTAIIIDTETKFNPLLRGLCCLMSLPPCGAT